MLASKGLKKALKKLPPLGLNLMIIVSSLEQSKSAVLPFGSLICLHIINSFYRQNLTKRKQSAVQTFCEKKQFLVSFAKNSTCMRLRTICSSLNPPTHQPPSFIQPSLNSLNVNGVFPKSFYNARYAHKHLCMVLPIYSKIQALPDIPSCRKMKDKKLAVDLNDLLKNDVTKDNYCKLQLL